MVQPAELLARLVNVLGYIPPRDDWDQNEDQSKQADAIQGDTQSKSIDSGLNGSESNWKIGGERFFTKPRSRAASETGYPTRNNSVQNTEWTWSGPVTSHKLQEMMTNDTISSSKENSSKPYRKFPSLALPITAPKNFFPRWRKQFTSKRSSDVGAEKTVEMTSDSERSNQRANSPIGPPPAYPDEAKRDSISRPYYTHTGGNLSSYLEGGNNLLEETTLADFLRALTALHARVGTIPDEYAAKPKRKMGTASLTPPKLPSLFTLFSQSATGSDSATQSMQNTVSDAQSYQSSRRMSLRTAENNYSGTTTPTSYIRRESVAVKPRRFSLRPVASTVNPLAPTNYGSSRLSVSLLLRTIEYKMRRCPTNQFLFVKCFLFSAKVYIDLTRILFSSVANLSEDG